MKVSVSAAGHPVMDGVPTRLVSIDPVAATASMQSAIKFSFTVTSGPTSGAKCFRTVGDRITPSNVAGKFVAGLFGRSELPVDREIDLSNLLGREFVVDVAQSSQGTGTRVEQARPVRANAAPKPQPQPEPESEPDFERFEISDNDEIPF